MIDRFLFFSHPLFGHSFCPFPYLKGISDTDISNLNLPTAVPYVFEFDDRLVLVKDYYLGNLEEIRKRAEAVAKQGMAKK